MHKIASVLVAILTVLALNVLNAWANGGQGNGGSGSGSGGGKGEYQAPG
jgi:hypothetical protein